MIKSTIHHRLLWASGPWLASARLHKIASLIKFFNTVTWHVGLWSIQKPLVTHNTHRGCSVLGVGRAGMLPWSCCYKNVLLHNFLLWFGWFWPWQYSAVQHVTLVFIQGQIAAHRQLHRILVCSYLHYPMSNIHLSCSSQAFYGLQKKEIRCRPISVSCDMQVARLAGLEDITKRTATIFCPGDACLSQVATTLWCCIPFSMDTGTLLSFMPQS